MHWMGREARPLATYDLEELAAYVDQQEYQAAFLDPATGEVYPAFEGQVPDEDGEPMDLDEVDWIAVGGGGSRQAYLDMEEFSQAVADPTLARRLTRALDGRGAFSRFRNEMYDAPEELRSVWHSFRELRAQIRALDWLVAEGLVDEQEATPAADALESQAQQALKAARPVRGTAGAGAPVDLADKLSQFTEHWSPKVVARMNDYEVKVVKLQGEFAWHTHDDTDELFLVLDGELTIQLRDGDVTLGPGQLYVVPRGVEHCPLADGEVSAVLIEPAGVVNTGDAGGALTATYDDTLLD